MSILRAMSLCAFVDRLSQVVAIIDIDCAVKNGFNEEDQKQLETLAGILAKACDW